jgi:hypothetical protein
VRQKVDRYLSPRSEPTFSHAKTPEPEEDEPAAPPPASPARRRLPLAAE